MVNLEGGVIMNSTQILRRNRDLEKEAEQLTNLCEDLISENEKLSLEKVKTNNQILDICLLLCYEVRENDFLHLQADSEGTNGEFNIIRVLIKALLHKNDSSEIDNEALGEIIHDIYISLCRKTQKNDILHLETGPESISNMLNNICILVQELLHDNESLERQNSALKAQLKNAKLKENQ